MIPSSELGLPTQHGDGRQLHVQENVGAHAVLQAPRCVSSGGARRRRFGLIERLGGWQWLQRRRHPRRRAGPAEEEGRVEQPLEASGVVRVEPHEVDRLEAHLRLHAQNVPLCVPAQLPLPLGDPLVRVHRRADAPGIAVDASESDPSPAGTDGGNVSRASPVLTVAGCTCDGGRRRRRGRPPSAVPAISVVVAAATPALPG